MTIEQRRYGLADVVRLPLRCIPVPAVLYGLKYLLSGIVPTLQITATARFIDTAVAAAQGKVPSSAVYPPLFLVAALIAYTWLADALGSFAGVRLELGLRGRFREAVTEKRARLSYRFIEDPDAWDLTARVSEAPESRLKGFYDVLLGLSGLVLRIGGVLAVLLTQVWWTAPTIVAISVPLFFLAAKSGRASYETDREVTKYKRKYGYLGEVLSGRDAVEERALFSFSDALGARWRAQFDAAYRKEYATQKKWFVRMKTGSVLTACLSVAIVLVLLGPVFGGKLSLGLFISLVGSAFSLVQMMSWQLTYYVDQLARAREYMKDLTKFAALGETPDAVAPPVSPAPVFRSLELKNVRFSYPGTDARILDGLSMTILPGRHYAFVGVNGAGKTTVTKLLTGLYDGYEGEILLNGRELRTYPQGELKAFYSVVYQDFCRYSVTLRDNIALGDAGHMDAADAEGAAARLGLSDAAAKLPRGFDTPLGKLREGGQDLSGGEWQRVALARAMVSPAPLQILDEPTAALDPIGESRLYEEFEALSRGRTTVFISHRLGSTKLADEIEVIDGGRVRESGTHAELMALRGLYAGMYESQRSWYE